jgi:hypothetical protein
MAAGDIVKEQNLIVEVFTVKANEDVEKGEIVWNDGNGVLAAGTTAKGPYFMALEAHDYSEATSHEIKCVVAGAVEVQAKPAAAIKKGQYVELSTADGEVTLFDYSAGVFSDIVGIALEDAATTATTCKILLGTFP